MELYQLRTFLVVAEEKNLTRAAKRLFTTPPSISAHIKSLEDEWNVSLFRRTSKGMEITKKGEELRLKAEATLMAAQDLANHATGLQDHLLGTLRVGINTSAAYLRIPEALTRLRDTCPGIDVHLANSATGSIVKSLLVDEADAGYLFGSALDNTLMTHRLTVAELVVVAPTNLISAKSTADWGEFARHSWICSNDYCPFQSIVDKMFKERGLQYQRTVCTDDEATKIELIRAGIGLALIEKQEARQAVEQGGVVVWPAEPIHCDLSFAYHSKRRQDPLLRALRGAVFEGWGLVRNVSLTAS